LFNPTAAIKPNNPTYIAPITGEGSDAKTENNFPINGNTIIIAAPALTTLREATLVNPIAPMFSEYDVEPPPDCRSPAIRHPTPSAPRP